MLFVLLLGAFESLAATVPPTRSTYVEEVEPICKAATLANQNVLEGVEGMIREGKLKQAAARFLRVADALGSTVKQLAAVARPPADVRRLTTWLRHAKAGDALLRRIGRTLKEGKRGKVQGMANQLLKRTKRANAVVAGFDFNYCRLKPARFV